MRIISNSNKTPSLFKDCNKLIRLFSSKALTTFIENNFLPMVLPSAFGFGQGAAVALFESVIKEVKAKATTKIEDKTFFIDYATCL